MQAFANNIGSLTIPTKTLELLILQRRIVLDDNPILAWSFANVQLYRDGKDNVMPSKTKSKNKIDPVMSTIMALGICMASGQLQFKQ